MLDKIVKIFLWVIIGIAIGYAWRTIQILNVFEYVQSPHSVASGSVVAAMQRMGPRYDYKMVGETKLYVDTGAGYKNLRF